MDSQVQGDRPVGTPPTTPINAAEVRAIATAVIKRREKVLKELALR